MKLIIPIGKNNTKLPSILRAAIHLFVKNGIDRTTIEEIAKKAHVAEGALYRHFKSKDDVAWYLFSTHLSQFTTELMAKVLAERDLDSRMRKFVSECFSAFDRDRDLFTFLILTEHRELKKYPASYMHPGHVAVKIIEDAQKEGTVGPAEPYLLAALIIGAMIRVCVVRLYGRINKDPKEYSPQVADSLVALLKTFSYGRN